MKTFDISKNIILAFVILISIALKLSAHENTTSLISSDNVSIEKDKKAENISKRNVPSKKILCYERDKKGILDYIFPAILFFLGYILNWLVSIRTDRKRKKTIKKELEGNKNYLTEKYDVFKELPENDPSKLQGVETRLTEILKKDYFIHLSDTSWNQYKYVISDKEYIMSKAYMLIGEINALSNASIHTSTNNTIPQLVQAIIKAKAAIDEAIKKL